MMKINSTLSVLCLLLFALPLSATHNRAGEITYRQIDALTIEATVVTYTKASSVAADRDTLTIEWGDGAFSKAPRVNGGGFGELLAFDIKLNYYVAVHTYADEGAYSVSMTDPNRNGGVLNVDFPNSINIPFHLQAEINVFADPGISNQSVVLLEPPIDLAQIGQPFIHIPNGFDPDGDSVAYEFITPMMGVDEPVPNYLLLTEVMPGPDNTLTLDPVTGQLTWASPQQEGEYNVAILVKSYRDGELFESTIRDMQILVMNLNNTFPSCLIDISQDEVVEVMVGDTVIVEVTATDDDVDQNLALSSTSGLYSSDYFDSPAQFSTSGGGNTAGGTMEWIVKPEHARHEPYLVVFKAKDDYLNMGYAAFALARFRAIDPNATAVNEVRAETPELKLFPNPATDLLTLATDAANLPAEYSIWSIEGQLLQTGLLTSPVEQLSLQQLMTGQYVLRLIGRKGTTSRIFSTIRR